MAASAIIGPMVSSFATELGKRMAGGVADWAKRVWKRDAHGGRTEVGVELPDGATTIYVFQGKVWEGERRAFIASDPTDPELRGKVLIYDVSEHRWQPS